MVIYIGSSKVCIPHSELSKTSVPNHFKVFRYFCIKMAAQSTLATILRNLHIPGKPILLTNVYDAVSARTVTALPGT